MKELVTFCIQNPMVPITIGAVVIGGLLSALTVAEEYAVCVRRPRRLRRRK